MNEQQPCVCVPCRRCMRWSWSWGSCLTSGRTPGTRSRPPSELRPKWREGARHPTHNTHTTHTHTHTHTHIHRHAISENPPTHTQSHTHIHRHTHRHTTYTTHDTQIHTHTHTPH